MEKLLKTLKILIVEDEKRLAQLLKEAIADSFFRVVIAKDGNEGLKKFKTFKPDIVITDIMMPFCDGLEMTEKIKELDEKLDELKSKRERILASVEKLFEDEQKLKKRRE